MVGGAEKAPVIRHILLQPRIAGGDADALAQLVVRAQRLSHDAPDAVVYPAQLVHAAARQVEWFLDRAAASQLAPTAGSECSAPSSL